MRSVSDFIADHRKTTVGAGALAVALLAGIWFLAGGNSSSATGVPREKSYRAEIKRVLSGHSVKLKSGERLNYAGIRAPYKNEPLYEESRERNAQLVDGKKIRLRFDEEPYDAKQRVRAYVFTADGFVNEMLVKEGLAYVRLAAGERRFADKLLDAQVEARRKKRGLWKTWKTTSLARYPADPKYANFHRPDCEEVPKIKPERLAEFRTARRALDAGFAPCSKCQP